MSVDHVSFIFFGPAVAVQHNQYTDEQFRKLTKSLPFNGWLQLESARRAFQKNEAFIGAEPEINRQIRYRLRAGHWRFGHFLPHFDRVLTQRESVTREDWISVLQEIRRLWGQIFFGCERRQLHCKIESCDQQLFPTEYVLVYRELADDAYEDLRFYELLALTTVREFGGDLLGIYT